MEMMYEIVAKAIEEAGLKGKTHSYDYLNFFCLGNREALTHGDYVPPDKPEEGTDYSRAQINRRFMIYVRAKFMIDLAVGANGSFQHMSMHPSNDGFLEPESLLCIRKVRKVAETLWGLFIGDSIIDLPGHLLPFPIKVSDSGELSDLPDNGFFPDTEAKVEGETSLVLPPLLTT